MKNTKKRNKDKIQTPLEKYHKQPKMSTNKNKIESNKQRMKHTSALK